MTFIAEYESDQYDREVRLRHIRFSLRVEFGLSWEPWKGINLRASWLRGDTLGLTISSQVGKQSQWQRGGGKASSAKELNAKTGLPDGYDPRSWYDRMLFEAEQSGLYLREGSLKPGRKQGFDGDRKP